MNRKILALLIANLFVAAPAFSQSSDFRLSGSVGVGGIAVDDGDAKDPSKFNEYRDLSNGGLFTFDVRGRGSRYWLDFFGENLGRDDQYVNLRGGMQDAFKYRVYSDSLRHNFLFGGLTPYAGAGGAANTSTFPRANTSGWFPLELGYKRRDDGGYFELQSLTRWYFRADANQVTWQGSKSGASSQGTSPGNGFVDLAFPVEYTTKNATFEGGYNTSSMHFDVSWMTSKFENDLESITWSNGYFGGIDRTYLPPDNKLERFAANGSVRHLPGSSTLAARYTKDELKNSFSLATSYLSSGNVNTPSNPMRNYSGNVENETFSLTLSSMPTKGLDTRVYYNYRKRDDHSTHVTFGGTDGNHAISYDKDNYGFEAYYRFNRANRFGGGFDYLDTTRHGRPDYDRTKDSRWFAEWKNSSLDELGARLKYSHLDRESNFLNSTSGANANDSAYWERYATAFDLADVKQDYWKLTLDFTPAPYWDLSFEGILKDNKYGKSTLGRLKDDRREIYASLSYGEPGGPRFTLFGDAENIKYDSTHRVVGDSALSGAYEPSTAPTSANYNWSGKVNDKNYAYGIAVNWQATEKLALNASAIYYKTDGFVDLALQEGVPSSVTRPVPVSTWDDSKRTSLNIKGVYALNKTWTITGGYAYEKYDTTDSQYNGYLYIVTNSNAAQNAYLNGANAYTNYKANILYGLVTYRF